MAINLETIEKIEVSDGSYLTNNDIENITQQMNAYIKENDLDIHSTDDIKSNGNLIQIIQSSWHN